MKTNLAPIPVYRPTGPVWVAFRYEETPECCDFHVVKYGVRDLDDHEIARDMNEQDARTVAKALNMSAAMQEVIAAAVACADQLERVGDHRKDHPYVQDVRDSVSAFTEASAEEIK